MAQKTNPKSRVHDLLGAVLGLFAAIVMATSPWQVDTSGPYPFYKGALIFPLMALGLMVMGSVPSFIRLLRPGATDSWHLDGGGLPRRPAVVLSMAVAFIIGIPMIGLEISCILFTASMLYYLGHRSLKIYVFWPLLLSGVFYLVFKYFLDVYFPTPLLLEYLGG